MKKVVLHNVFGLKNLGDEAIYRGCLNVVNDAVKNKEIQLTTFCLDLPSMTSKTNLKFTVNHILSPYGFVISSLSDPFKLLKKCYLFLYLTLGSLITITLISISKSFLPKKHPFNFITEIYHCDIFFGMGGGYLRTKSKYSDYFGLILTLIPIFIAKFYKKKIVFFPASFGDFASSIHKYMSYWALVNTTSYLRDENSMLLLNDVDKSNLVRKKFSPDLALYPSKVRGSLSNSKLEKYIVLTARVWLNNEKQKLFERALADVIKYAYRKHHLVTHFIPMASHKDEDDDTLVFYRLQQLVNNPASLKLVRVEGLTQVKSVISNATLAVCTRMHSAIFSATAYRPFIAIAYESKTNGFMKLMDMEDYVLNIEDVTFVKLKQLFTKLIKKPENNRVTQVLKRNLQKMQLYRKELVIDIRNALT